MKEHNTHIQLHPASKFPSFLLSLSLSEPIYQSAMAFSLPNFSFHVSLLQKGTFFTLLLLTHFLYFSHSLTHS